MLLDKFRKVSDAPDRHKLKGYNEVLKVTENHAKLNIGMYQAQIVAKCQDIEIEKDCELSTMVYFATHEVREKARKEKEKQLLKEGYQFLTVEMVEQAIENQTKLEIVETEPHNLFTRDGKYKPVKSNHGLGLIPSRKRTRGYYLLEFLESKSVAKFI